MIFCVEEFLNLGIILYVEVNEHYHDISTALCVILFIFCVLFSKITIAPSVWMLFYALRVMTPNR